MSNMQHGQATLLRNFVAQRSCLGNSTVNFPLQTIAKQTQLLVTQTTT